MSIFPDDIPERLRTYKLHWVEVAKLTQQFHNARCLVHGQATKTGGQSSNGWSLRKTVAELDRSLGTIWTDLEILKYSDKHPNLLKIERRTDAVDALNKIKISES